MVDPNCRPSVIADRAAYLARLDAVFARADVVKVSGDDLAYLVPGVDPREAARTLLERGPSVVLLTDGGRGVVVLTRAATLDIPVPAVRVVDTVGAGDAFGGGFLARWVERGLGRADLADPAALRDAVTLAIEVAGITCQRAGADPPRRCRARAGHRPDGPIRARLSRMSNDPPPPPAARRRRLRARGDRRSDRRRDPDLPDPEPGRPRRRRARHPGPPAAHGFSVADRRDLRAVDRRPGQGVPGRQGAARVGHRLAVGLEEAGRRPRAGQHRRGRQGRPAPAQREAVRRDRRDRDVRRGRRPQRGQDLPDAHGVDGQRPRRADDLAEPRLALRLRGFNGDDPVRLQRSATARPTGGPAPASGCWRPGRRVRQVGQGRRRRGRPRAGSTVATSAGMPPTRSASTSTSGRSATTGTSAPGAPTGEARPTTGRPRGSSSRPSGPRPPATSSSSTSTTRCSSARASRPSTPTTTTTCTSATASPRTRFALPLLTPRGRAADRVP